MKQILIRAYDWYHGGGRAVRAWTAAAAIVGSAAVATASISVLAETATHPAAAQPAAGAGEVFAPGSNAPSTPTSIANMPSMGSGTSTSGPTNADTAQTSSVCPDVTGATVMANGMVMAPVPSGPPTVAEQAAANQLVSQVEAATEHYSSLAAAEADGYRAASSRPGRGPYSHYINPGVVESHDVLDPSHPSALMYANTVDGPVLVGAMFLGPAPCIPGADIGGPLTDWHAHDNLCTSQGFIVGHTGSDDTCTIGTHKTDTYFMLHVWTAPSIAAQYQFQADVPPSAFRPIIESGQP